ncbi:MAG: hypothetical protein M0Z46_20040 [Actinomycetota bacterium]|jgi:hypothetical protein|nr:hypothetical protein [Actinomycetota bacterium]
MTTVGTELLSLGTELLATGEQVLEEAAPPHRPRRPPRGFRSWTAYRDELARRKGWTSYSQQRWWITTRHLTSTSELVARLAAECNLRHCHHIMPTTDRAGSLFCDACNDVINPRTQPRWETWQIRLVRHVMELRRRDNRGRFVRRRQTDLDREIARLMVRAT